MFARTERLLLRPSWPEDADELHLLANDEAIARNLTLYPWPYGPKDAAAFAQAAYDIHYPNFLLMQRTDGAPRLIGACGLHNRDGDAELGYWIARPYWGLGYASEAAQAVVALARSLGHSRLVSAHFTDNPASGHVLRKLGFRSLGKIEKRYSNCRGHEAPCALYERTLGSDRIAAVAAARPATHVPYDSQLIAA